MSNEYFKNFETIQYPLNDKLVSIKNFFKKTTVEQKSLYDVVDYTFYELSEGERPDIVASKLYGDSDLYWVLLLVNEIENLNEWHKDSPTFESYMNEKYEGKYLNATASTDIVSSTSKFLIGEAITYTDTVDPTNGRGGHVVEVDPTFNRIGVVGDFPRLNSVTGGSSEKSFTPSSIIERRDGVSYYKNSDDTLRRNTSASGYSAVTFYDDEFAKNEEKRKIKIVRPNIVNQVVKEFERLMS